MLLPDMEKTIRKMKSLLDPKTLQSFLEEMNAKIISVKDKKECFIYKIESPHDWFKGYVSAGNESELFYPIKRKPLPLGKAPQAYKVMDKVMEDQRELVEILVELKPIAVLKG